MFSLDSLIYFHLIGAIFSVLSFLVFISALKSSAGIFLDDYTNSEWINEEPLENYTYAYNQEVVQNNNTKENSFYNDDSDEYYTDEAEEENEVDVTEKTNFSKLNFLSSLFKKNNKSLEVENEETVEENIENQQIEEDSEELYDIEFDDFDPFEIQEDELTRETENIEVDDNVDEEVYEDFPHEQRGITIFSKEEITDEEIGDLKELITTIKSEFNFDTKVNLNDIMVGVDE